MLKRKTLAIALLSASPFIAQADPTLYGTFGFGYTDNEPMGESLDYEGNHIKDTVPVAFALGANFNSRWAIDLAAAYSPLQGDDQVDYEQYNINGFYFITEHKTKPYIGLNLSYEDIHAPDGIDKETLSYGGSLGLQHDFNQRIFSRLEGRLLDTRSTNIEHATVMFEVGYRFGGGALSFAKAETQAQPCRAAFQRL